MKVSDDKQVFKFRALEQAQVTLMEIGGVEQLALRTLSLLLSRLHSL